ncbi:type II toxin-antitoxin system RelE/ParE family toxin [Bradyrhizobium australiense]|uniref:Type II toxin-antitoxin system RelE/ParE family toxin n=1 Tax=Bradyrhizobium australiense TaxID=2721161 RepID=A0A7Y4LTP7_9BRAD|nr:type II toxin-antitoxin system RelE/ParE family toxin [Bradyrhizobium australiense]NOJ38251.1 type II toxin-antitoxin system RelE/ParE family toxin [Bradyrhizobium australiense]
MTLRFTPRARDDLREIMEYIANENPAAADRVGLAIFDTCALSPRGLIWEFAMQERRNCGAAWSRDIRTGYFVEDANVWIVHIRHSARRPVDEQI